MAADDLPSIVVNFLNVIGVKWPYVNEDSLFDFGNVVREFGNAVQTTHEDATSTVSQTGSAWKGPGYEQFNSGWSQLTAGQVSDLVTACHVVADAFDVAAGFIIERKGEAIAQLITLASAFIEAQAAAVETFGLAETAVPLIIAAGRKIGDALVMELEQHIIEKLTSAAIEPFLEKVENAMNTLHWSGQGPASSNSGGTGFGVDTVQLRAHATTMHGHGDQFGQHATSLTNKASSITF